jgi:ClpP class serine protease
MFNTNTLFWVFLAIVALQPVLSRKFLEASRQRLIERIERKRGSRLILLVHRQETMSLLGFPLVRYIDVNDSEQILRALQLTNPSIPVDLVLHTPGGLVLAATQIAHAIHKRPGKVTVFVPHYAMSGGTLIALAADEIVMCEHAVMGPLDPQIGQYPAPSLLKVVASKPIEKVDDETLILADQAGKAIAQLRSTVEELLADKMDKPRAEELAGVLTEGTWTHDYPITIDTARGLGLNVSGSMPPEILQLMSLFPQPVQQRPTVEYVERPYAARPGKSGR